MLLFSYYPKKSHYNTCITITTIQTPLQVQARCVCTKLHSLIIETVLIYMFASKLSFYLFFTIGWTV